MVYGSDKFNGKTLVINSSKIDGNYLIGTFITEFDSNYNGNRNIKSSKIDVSDKKWLIYDVKFIIKIIMIIKVI